METGGVRCSRFLPGFGSFLDPPASDIGGVPPIGTALVTEFCSASHPRDHDSFMAVVSVALGRLGRPRCRAIHVDLWLARARPTRPRRRCAERNRTVRLRVMSPDGKPARLRHRIPKKNPKPGKNGNSGRPLFPRVPPCFLSAICFWRK